jgi:hypothetical protein
VIQYESLVLNNYYKPHCIIFATPQTIALQTI